ncbi:RING/U-box domain-containing protein isoform 1 [Hibiscus syriacus]|uniref:RING/U-box domain-containing protein isoform 1 n=1 Tax=Hibiscus syriacus TaxID=106335 RepID=A0A6A3C854_HIBSY|nr:RING/U-box domain-containing protein isoform 1 [Hibiscus syriacus]
MIRVSKPYLPRVKSFGRVDSGWFGSAGSVEGLLDQELTHPDAAMKTSSEFERATKAVQDNPTETNKRLKELEFENSGLNDIEKENALLKYKLHVVEKELEIKNEEMEYIRRSADLARKQHLDGAKRMAMLEAECRKLLKAEEGNRSLKALMIQPSRLDHFRILSRPNRVEIPTMEIVRSGHISRELSVTSEMEKLALVSGSGYNPISHGEDHCEFSNTKQMNSLDLAAEGSFDWLQVVLHAISEHKRVSNRGFDEILDDIEIALDFSNRLSAHDVVDISEEQSHNFASSHDRNQSAMSQEDDIRCSLQEENRRLKDDLNSMEAMLESETNENETLTIKLNESEESIGILLTELKMIKESNEMIEDEVENETQLTVAKAKLNEIFQKCSSLEVDLEYKNNCCEELEATCLELQLQLESMAKKEAPNYATIQEGKQSQNGWEITAASVKLAECQEIIMNLREKGEETLLLARSNASRRWGIKEKGPSLPTSEADRLSKNGSGNVGAMALARMPSKKQGVVFLRMLFLRRKKGYCKKTCHRATEG